MAMLCCAWSPLLCVLCGVWCLSLAFAPVHASFRNEQMKQVLFPSFSGDSDVPLFSTRSAREAARASKARARGAAPRGSCKMRAFADDTVAAGAVQEEDLEANLRQAAMEWDALDADRSRTLDFAEFSALVREREVGIHSETALEARYAHIDVDGSGTITVGEYIVHSIREALARSASAPARPSASTRVSAPAMRLGDKKPRAPLLLAKQGGLRGCGRTSPMTSVGRQRGSVSGREARRLIVRRKGRRRRRTARAMDGRGLGRGGGVLGARWVIQVARPPPASIDGDGRTRPTTSTYTYKQRPRPRTWTYERRYLHSCREWGLGE